MTRRVEPLASSAPAASLRVWSGRLFLWPGRAAYIGQAADTTVHAHHAIQLCIAIDGSFRLRGGPRARWSHQHVALIPPDREHQLDGHGAVLALVYLDPEADAARQLLTAQPPKSFAIGRERIPNRTRARLAALASSECGAEEAGSAIDETIAGIIPAYNRTSALDPRIAGLVAHLSCLSGARMTAADGAAFVGLSSYRFQHIFRANTGISFRRYLLWLRLVSSVGYLARGDSLTDTAHAVGFSDSAHLSRTFRRMFGLSPSELAKGSTFVQASDQGVS